jgi:PAS domain S-box-containing protein
MSAEGHGEHLADFVQQERDGILRDWEEMVLRVPIARTLNRRALFNHLPWMLERIADMIRDDEMHLPVRSPADDAHIHATERLDEGYDLETVVAEYAVLRECVLRRWQQHNEQSGSGVVVLNRAIDQAVSASVSKFVSARERTLAALDHLSAIALTVPGIRSFLHDLSDVVVQTIAAVDSLAVFLTEPPDRLRLEVAVGLEEELPDGLSYSVGEGCAGLIAAQRRPIELLDASRNERVSDLLRTRRIRSLYGVPMMHEDQLIGVAHISSVSAFRFTSDDKLLFRSMVDRATSVVVETQLRDREHAARVEAERERGQLDALLLSATMGIELFDKELRFVRISRMLAEINGHTVAEHLGRPLAELSPVFAGRYEPQLRQVLETGEPFLNVEAETQAPGTRLGRRSWLLNYYPVRDPVGQIIGVGGVIVEVTRQKEIEVDLKHALDAVARGAAELRTLADSIPNMVWVVSPEGRMEFVNRVAADYLGRSTKSLQGESLLSAVHPDDREETATVWAESSQTGREFEHPFRLRSADGTYRRFLSRATPLRDDTGKVLRWVGTSTDVEEMKREEAAASRRAEFAQRLIGIASHDLRNPLSAVIMGSERLLRRYPDDAELRRSATLVRSAGQRAGRLVHDLLDFARAELKGDIPMRKSSLDLFQALTLAVEELRVSNPSRMIDLRVAGSGLGDWDSDRLSQAVLNLVGNALTYSPRDSPVIVDLIGLPTEVEIRVRNGGPPIPPEAMARLFAPMERAHRAGQNDHNVGLGLYIVQEIVHAHGGTVSVTSTEQEGTVFTLKLPRNVDQATGRSLGLH